MSTYYQFVCDEHKIIGGHFTRQAWGAGNADLIDTFKFVMHHAITCGTANIRMISEHEDEYHWPDTNVPSPERFQHLQDTADIFPHSNDWEFIRTHLTSANTTWVEQELEATEADL